MARPSSQPALGAREPASRDRDAGTDLSPATPIETTDNGSGASPEQPAIVPEPFNPNFDDRNAENTEVGLGVPGLGGGDEEARIRVKTTGAFQIQDPYTLDLVPHDKSENVRHTSFIQTAIDDGRLKRA
ncbi:MAG: hypothetical protein ABW128_22765 [Rhizorhabdus sp.]